MRIFVKMVALLSSDKNTVPPCFFSFIGCILTFFLIFFKFEHNLMDELVRNQGLANLFEWITNKTSEDCRKHFIASVRCSLEKPSLLVMCKHETRAEVQ